MSVKDFNYSILMSVYYKEKPEWLKLSIESMLNQTIKSDDFVIIKNESIQKKLNKIISEYEKNIQIYLMLFNWKKM